MSLVTDWIGAGAALTVVVGSGIQASQSFAELNAETPLVNNVVPLFLAALQTLFKVVIARTNVATMEPLLARLQLITAAPTELTAAQAAVLTPEQAAVLGAGRATALTPEQTAAMRAGQPISLTPGQTAALTAARVKNLKKWLGLFLGWFFISIGALAALAGAALMLAIDW